MLSLTRRYWPRITSVLILWMAVAICLTLSLRQNQGHLVYVLDDPYIHMAIANYAVDRSETDLLIEILKIFSSFLPKNIVQTGEYTIKSG